MTARKLQALRSELAALQALIRTGRATAAQIRRAAQISSALGLSPSL